MSNISFNGRVSSVPGGLCGSAVMWGGSFTEGSQADHQGGGGVILGSSIWEITVKFLVSQYKVKAGF